MIKPKIYFVATVEFAVNAFLKKHLSLLSHKFDVTVFTNTSDPLFLDKEGIKVNVIPFNIQRDIKIVSDIKAVLFLFFFFLRDKPKSVQSITPKAGLVAMLAAFFACVPLKVHTFTGQVWVNKKGFYGYVLKKIDALIALFADYSIVDSKSQCDYLVQEKILPQKKSIVFGSGSVSGVDLKRFKANKKTYAEIRTQLSIPHDAFVYIYLGRLNKDKGVLDLACAFSKIQNDRAYLIVVGPDEANLSQQIESLVGLNLNRLRLVGFSGEPYRYLAASDVLCLPSYREGFGSVIIEAAAMGLPAIASNIYGISDAVQNHKTGLLHPPKDVDAIRNCMEKFLLEPKLVKSYGLAAKKRAISEFDAKLLSQYWMDFYLSHVH